MSRALAVAALTLSSFATPTLFAATPVGAAVTCDENAPAEWRRPGGYCDQLEGKDSLSEPVDGNPCKITFLYELLHEIPIGEETLVAAC